MRGRKTNLVSIEGGKLPGRCPSPPGGLCTHGKAEWKRVAPIVHERGLLGDDTLATLESYCRSVGLCRSYSAMMDADGHVLQTEKGPVTHPAFKMLMGAMREQRLLATELGLTPHRRGKAAQDGKKGDGWDADLLA
jgi:P27 family predicted phage terminase small subunit